MKEEITKPLGETTSEKIIKLIVDENLKIGDKLPNEYELADKLGVGRSTIREAIKALVSRNILEIKRGSGTFIKCGVADDPLGLMFVKDKLKLAVDLLEIRFMIEPKIASLAAINATKEDIEELSKLCDEVEELILNGIPHMEKDIEFHTAIARSSKNLVTTSLVPIINKSIAVFIDVTNTQLKNETIETHKEILNAIRNKNANEAHDAMLLHLAYNRRNINRIVAEKN
ncbi:FadR/GntR family transcriptional regulator [Romboutsia sp. 1001216sp1]|uniref:FadR/GntR family transcriptional regulator n=2 Tax=Romboutsia sp. 1001216sp1 TaxID=2986997 RepID=UPI002330497C|nr:FadR/GntR family transcriptional regulator [Romboutsia sp. 1001216sp1]MDB8803643.1 FadR/GntR family transcriptional regulator [Romboutsia sp. 1001216sp1]MDB8807855.1 FadR/GntR family transcriptional regulator [Romboutsia sp. 1001216sp1]MDB8809291.1 FadR/GntR family transcriptional regulator [Romboutsia sp. 1001216sp1]MDB8815039.1 FadR/GntR family transcriptional regulator [Romboutsia sp. 1001216sp1]MDB8817733.1 FadR/GntR family transcriptional regulator [Romboutsia sp. 1001216sp1]